MQCFAVGVTALYSLAGTYILYKLVDLIMKVRVKTKEEEIGLDLTQHHEAAYTVLE